MRIVKPPGCGGLVRNVRTLENTPALFWILTLALPAEAIRFAGTAAVSWPPVTNVVLKGEPFHSTMELLTNPVPTATIVNAGPPAVAELGVRLVRVSGCALMTKVRTFEKIPAPFWTLTLALP